MDLRLNNGLQEEYDYCKTIYQKKVAGGYRAPEINMLKVAGFSDDDIFFAELLGIAKGYLESNLMDGLI